MGLLAVVKVIAVIGVVFTVPVLLLLMEALQLQRSFDFLNVFLPVGSIFDAVLSVVYSNFYYIIFNIILPPVFGSS
jgi:hypothetical protein